MTYGLTARLLSLRHDKYYKKNSSLPSSCRVLKFARRFPETIRRGGL